MINCKEDLMNKHIENDNGELRELFFNYCIKFGLHDNSRCPMLGYDQLGSIISKWPKFDVLQYGPSPKSKQLTLADFQAGCDSAKPADVEMEAFNDEYNRGMYNCVCDIAESVGYKFGVDIGFDDLPDKVESVLSGLTATIDQLVPPSKPVKTKVEYVFIKCGETPFWEVAKEFAESELNTIHFINVHCEQCEVKCNNMLLSNYKSGNLYRKVETKVTWQDEASDKHPKMMESLRDSFYNEDIIKFSHLVASMTDKPTGANHE